CSLHLPLHLRLFQRLVSQYPHLHSPILRSGLWRHFVAQGLTPTISMGLDPVLLHALRYQIFLYSLNTIFRQLQIGFRTAYIIGVTFQLNFHSWIFLHHLSNFVKLAKRLRIDGRLAACEDQVVEDNRLTLRG